MASDHGNDRLDTFLAQVHCITMPCPTLFYFTLSTPYSVTMIQHPSIVCVCNHIVPVKGPHDSSITRDDSERMGALCILIFVGP